MAVASVLPGVEIHAPVPESYAEILTPEAIAFVADLHRTFNERRRTKGSAMPRGQWRRYLRTFSTGASRSRAPSTAR